MHQGGVRVAGGVFPLGGRHTMARARLRFGRFDYATFGAMFCYAACSLAVPMALVAMGRALGFPMDAASDASADGAGSSGGGGHMAAGGFLQMGRSVMMVTSMLFCGVFAARWGKTRTLAASLTLMSTGILCCAMAPAGSAAVAYGVVLCAMAVAGLGEGVLEGLLTPYVQELHPEESGRYLNFTHSFWSVGTLGTVLAMGAVMNQFPMATHPDTWRWLLGGVALLSTIPLLLYIGPGARRHRPLAVPSPASEDGEASPVALSVRGAPMSRLTAKDVGRQTWAILSCRRFWVFFGAMFFAGGGEFGITFWMPTYIHNVRGGSEWQAGLGTACFAAGMVVGRMGWGVLVHQDKLRRLVLGSGGAGMVVALAFTPLVPEGTLSTTALYVLLGLAGLASAPFWPSIQSYCGDRLPQLDKTMLFVLLSCAGIPGCGFFSWAMGFVGGVFGDDLRYGFILPPLAYAAMCALMMWERRHFHAERRRALTPAS